MTEEEKKRIKLIVETIDTVIEKLEKIDEMILNGEPIRPRDERYKTFKLYFKSVKDQIRRLRDNSKFLF